MDVFWTGTKKLRKEGIAIPSRIAVLLSQYCACQGWPYRFDVRDIRDLCDESVLPGATALPKGNIQFSVDSILEWLAEPQGLQQAIELLSRLGEHRAIEEHERRVAEQFARDAREEALKLYRQGVQHRAQELCRELDKGGQFEHDLIQAVADVIKKHYGQIPATVARLIANDLDTKISLEQATRKYGHRFTAKILDGLAEPWLKRILSTGGKKVDHDIVERALKWVGSLKQVKSAVYVVKPSGIRAVKIGIAACVDSRIGGIQTGSPFPVKCLLAFPGGRAAEEMLHKTFQSTRLSGEWFVLDATMQQFVIEGRGKLNKILAIAASERLGNRFKRHLDLIQKHGAQEDWLTQSHGMSFFEAEKMVNRVNELIENPECMPEDADAVTA